VSSLSELTLGRPGSTMGNIARGVIQRLTVPEGMSE
jgi:hypothetical protein